MWILAQKTRPENTEIIKPTMSTNCNLSASTRTWNKFRHQPTVPQPKRLRGCC